MIKINTFFLKFLLLSIIFLRLAYAQDTIIVMHYNLLYYGVNIFDCNQTTNNIHKKNKALRNITEYVKPDIFTVNEISSNPNYHKMILDSVLNFNGANVYKHATITNYSGTVIVNQLFYNQYKFAISREYALLGGDRDINVYKLYYKSPDLQWSQDTVFLTIIVAHLSSGSDETSKQKRDAEVAIVMNHLSTLPSPHNYLFQGDFNVYGASEPAFQRIINNPNQNIRLYDPTNKVGEWSNNATFAAYHTQSSHTEGPCFIGGGLDDRFDFIMISMPIFTGSKKVRYIPGSYKTLGQDGQRFKKSLIDLPPNTSAPSDVIQSLYDMSDHLPIYLKLFIDQTPAEKVEFNISQIYINCQNPFSDAISCLISNNYSKSLLIQIYDLTGRLIHSDQIENNINSLFEIPTTSFEKGIYLMHLIPNNSKPVIIKLLKNQ